MFVWQAEGWPKMIWDSSALIERLEHARLAQGRMASLAEAIAVAESRDAQAQALFDEILQSHAIEGERLNHASLRSSIARQFGLEHAGMPKPSAREEGAVAVLLDALTRFDEPLTEARLFEWHTSIFPDGRSGMQPISTGAWRRGPMSVVSGPIGFEKVHFVAPGPEQVQNEMAAFLEWFNQSRGSMSGLLRAALAHFWFVIIHPFDDGNGRIARTITDLALAQDEGSAMRFHSLSAAIIRDRPAYYEAIQAAQTRMDLNVTAWMQWFLGAFTHSVRSAEERIAKVLGKAAYWQRHSDAGLNDRQKKVLMRLLDAGDDFVGNLNARKYMGMTKCSKATATRDLIELTERGFIEPTGAGGRSTAYRLKIL